MLIKIRKKFSKAQASLEYAALIGVVIGAIIIMSVFMKRAVEGRLRTSSDQVGDQFDIEAGNYEYSSHLEDSEVTYTSFGATDNDPDISGLSPDFNYTRTTQGEGVQIQVTTDAGTRTINETTRTESYR